MTALLRLFRTTAFKLSLAYLLVFTLVAGGTIAYLGWRTTALLDEQITSTVDAEIGGLAEAYRQGGIRRVVDTVQARTVRPGATIYLVASFTGQTLAGNVAALPPGVLDRAALLETSYRRAEDGDEAPARRALARVSVLPAGFRLLVGQDTAERDRLQAIIRRAALSSIALIVTLGLVGGFLVSRRVLARIDAVAETSRTIMAGDLSGRIKLTGSGDEFDRLGASLNAMLERISVLMRGLQEVSENIAHDLKTPLTRVRNQAEAALRGAPPESAAALARIIEESEGLIRTFEALLMIARAEAGHAENPVEPVDLSRIARDVAELYEPVAEEAGFSLELDLAQELTLAGSRELLSQAVANLMDNAVKHGRHEAGGGRSIVRLATRRAGAALELRVGDHGPGVPEAERARVLERFVRLEESRSRPGSGLGLSLVAAVAHLHRGTLRLEDNAPGLRAVLALPADTGAARASGSDVSAPRMPVLGTPRPPLPSPGRPA